MKEHGDRPILIAEFSAEALAAIFVATLPEEKTEAMTTGGMTVGAAGYRSAGRAGRRGSVTVGFAHVTHERRGLVTRTHMESRAPWAAITAWFAPRFYDDRAVCVIDPEEGR